jgi:hypothetical protein
VRFFFSSIRIALLELSRLSRFSRIGLMFGCFHASPDWFNSVRIIRRASCGDDFLFIMFGRRD